MKKPFWQLGELSDEHLLQDLAVLQARGSRVTAELVAHLGEVEHRRLHLLAACSSLFEYCVQRLGLSEDEACRRIEVSRLARRFPVLFPLLEEGQLSLSVAALLKPHLTESNPAELAGAVAGQSVRQARETLAARFPSPDVPSSVRKLPSRPTEAESTQAQASSPTAFAARGGLGAADASVESTPADASVELEAADASVELEAADASVESGAVAAPAAAGIAQGVPLPRAVALGAQGATNSAGRAHPLARLPDDTAAFSLRSPASPAPPQSRQSKAKIEPLSAQRYRVQFTASVELKQKLELARDWMRHQNPSGDFAPIVEQALDLLLDHLQKRRFGGTAKSPSSERAPRPPPPSRSAASSAQRAPARAPASAATAHSKPSPTSAPADASSPVTASGSTTSATAMPARIGNATRRSVSQRDGLRCCWSDAHGERCGSRAWLEFDHRKPRGKGGGSDAENVRLLCRAHNQLAAELEYGRAPMDRAIAARRRRAKNQPLGVRDGRSPYCGGQPAIRDVADRPRERSARLLPTRPIPVPHAALPPIPQSRARHLRERSSHSKSSSKSPKSRARDMCERSTPQGPPHLINTVRPKPASFFQFHKVEPGASASEASQWSLLPVQQSRVRSQRERARPKGRLT